MKRRQEAEIQNTIRAELSRGPTRLFRQNSGTGWTGEHTRTRDGAVVIKDPRPLHAGFKGLSYLGGWHTVTITQEMVGRQVAVYVALEVKTKTGRASAEQQRFVETVTAAGGIAGVVRSVGAARDLILSFTGGTVIPTGDCCSHIEGDGESQPTADGADYEGETK